LFYLVLTPNSGPQQVQITNYCLMEYC